MKVAIVQFPGTNCEYDTEYAFKDLGCETTILWHQETTIADDIELVVIAGGFSYGDYLRSGAIARFSPIMDAVQKYAAESRKVLGICNGFQVLTESHLLPGALKRNEHLHFISKHHHLKVESTDNAFLSKCEKGEVLNIPIAHHDGNFFIAEDELEELYANNQVLLKYCAADGSELNPNGSVDSIAGICNKEKTVFGLMPHPERAMEALLGSDDGRKMLEALVR